MVYASMQCVYAVKNSITGRVYVGQTKNFNQRKAGHLYSARRGDQRPLYCAIREYGVDAFIFEILEECDDSHLAAAREAFWIRHFDSFRNGYNLTHGGGYHVGNRGRKFTDEHRQKISAALKGRSPSIESRLKMAAAKCGVKREPRSSETKAKISAALTGRKLSKKTRKKISDTLKAKQRNGGIET